MKDLEARLAMAPIRRPGSASPKRAARPVRAPIEYVLTLRSPDGRWLCEVMENRPSRLTMMFLQHTSAPLAEVQAGTGAVAVFSAAGTG